jgi:hypothetical protein
MSLRLMPLLWVGLLSPALHAQPAPTARAAADTLLAAAGLPNVLAGLGTVVQAQISRTAPALPPPLAARAHDAVARHFAGAQLQESIVATLSSQAPPERLNEVYAWITAGPVGEARRLAGAYRPPLPLEEFAAALAELPPPQARVLLMLRLARAQGAGPLYLTIAEAARGAASTAARALDPSLPPFRALPDDQVALALETHDQQAVLLFLHRYATIPDELIASVAERYEDESGRWYVDALTRAVRDALLTAAERVAEELRGLGGRGARRARGNA